MKKIKIKTYDDPFRSDQKSDAQRIVDALASEGYECTIDQAIRLWEIYSDDFCAGWLILPEKDSEIVDSIRSYFEVEDDS